MSDHAITWTSPAPLWPDSADVVNGAATASADFLRPAILRFASDQFMNEYLAVLNNAPVRLREYIAQPETWQQPSPTPPPVTPPPPFLQALTGKRPPLPKAANPVAPPAQPLKLFQPVHLRYYLVSGCLVCQTPGLPNRTPDPTKKERATFVLRRLSSQSGATEYAFVDKQWKAVSEDAKQLVSGEEQLPLSSAVFTASDGRKRRQFAALVPCGKREEYMGAPIAGSAGATPPDPRIELFTRKVTGPIQVLYTLASTAKKANQNIRAATDQAQQASWYVLLDFADYLKGYATPVWNAAGDSSLEAGLKPQEQALLDHISAPTYTAPDATKTTLREALVAIAKDSERQKLATATGSFDSTNPNSVKQFPSLRFLFADPATGLPALMPRPGLKKTERLMKGALPEPAPAGLPLPAPSLASQGIADPGGFNWFAVRLVFERPLCGPLSQTVVSQQSAAFQLAGFFDSDAPARPLLIPLPVDTTPDGLRKHDKNAGFMMSDVLCGQMKRFEGLSLGDLIRAVLPAPFGSPLSAGSDAPCGTAASPAGQICSLSIPIVTICAFILLIMIAKLLDLIFNWMPFFRICFPIPNFKAKTGA